jgi:PKD repeat protein
VPIAINVTLNGEGDGATVTGPAPFTVAPLGAQIMFGGTYVSDTWDFGEGAPVAGPDPPDHTYLSPGTYTVTNACYFTGGPGSPQIATWTVVVTGSSNWWTNFVGTAEIV